MAIRAIRGSCDMGRPHGLRLFASIRAVMARITIVTRPLVRITGQRHVRRESACGRSMAGVTIQRGRNMIGALPCRSGAIVTRSARPRNSSMIKHSTQPCAGIMALNAISGCSDMVGGLTRRLHTIVTGSTIPCNPRMIKCHREPTACTVMTGITCGIGGNMRRRLACRGRTVMTRCTGTRDLLMVNNTHRCKSGRRMARFTHRGRCDVHLGFRHTGNR